MKAKRRESEIKKPILILGITFIVLGCSLGVTSLAWFMNPTNRKTVEGIDGQATGNYFDGGDGSKESPYGISTAKQLYYFNWLQDLGYFNKDANGKSIETGTIAKQYYFVLKKDIVASKYVLPPAGTTKYPFVGHFEGGGYTVSNLTISNVWSELGGDDGKYPQGASEDSTQGILQDAEIVGFFGVIGEYAKSAAGTTASKATGDDGVEVTTYANSGSLVYNVKSTTGSEENKDLVTTYINSVNNLYFENLTIKSGANQALAGLIAGYANGQIDNCGVQSGQFSFKDKVANLSDGTLSESNLSNYTLIGDYTKNLNWTGNPGEQSGGTGNDWGGSIDIYDFTKRLTYILNKNQTYNAFTITGSNEPMGLKGISFNWKSTKVLYEMERNAISIYNESYFPINVDTETEFKNETRGTITSGGKSVPYATTDYFNNSANTTEKILDSNTGYITTASSKNDTQLNIRENQYIGASLGLKWNNNSYVSGTYDEDKLVMLSIDSSGNLSRIVDGENTTNNTNLNSSYPNTVNASDLSQYSKVKTRIKDFLLNDNNYFYPLLWNASGSPSTINGTFKLNGTTYTTAYAPGIDFYVTNEGYITVVFASNYNTNGNKLFTLYKVTRSNGTPSLSKVENVIPSTTSTFCTSYALLYLEIPVEPGEYFIGSDVDNTSANTSAGFMYLDIGANAGEKKEEKTDPDPTNIDFVYKNNGAIVKITDDGYVPSGVNFSFKGTSSSGWLYFKRNTSTGGVFFCVLTDSGYTVTSAGTGTKTGKSTKEDYDNATA